MCLCPFLSVIVSRDNFRDPWYLSDSSGDIVRDAGIPPPPLPLSHACVVCRLFVEQRLAGAPPKVQAGVQNLMRQGVAVEWDIDVRVSNALLQVGSAFYFILLLYSLFCCRGNLGFVSWPVRAVYSVA